MKFLRKFPYWYLIAVPALLFGLGMASNEAVFITNHSKFPVMINDAQYSANCTASEETAGAPPSACVNGGQMLDRRHSIMGPNTHMKVLADIFPIDGFTYSIGDGLLALGGYLFPLTSMMWLALTIRKLATLVN